MPNSVRQTTSNTFSKGLVMDFDPTVTQNDRMVNALNATLLTFNGNEMNLQQDMGNGRVETAFLPEGYIPVGSCEFGDIIYIVSYNPLENKSQIGCFPSPERNISSDETVDLQQNVSASDFQTFSNGAPTGVLIATSAKKIVYGDQNMNPGDKYIIYTTTEGFGGSNPERLSDFANTSHTHNTWPKLLKLSVVAIEDSGKIVDLNASVKWYDNDYYINDQYDSEGNIDLDSYRSLVSSAYAVFQSKVSGKLAILAELETIDGFSYTYDVYIKEATGTTSDDGSVVTSNSSYDIYFYTSWETSHNDINPTGYLFTKSEWTNVEDGGKPNMPIYNDTTNVVTYTYDQVHSLPIDLDNDEKKWVVRDDNGKVISYDYDSIIYTYTRLYELDNPSADFSTYIDTESYNAQIDAIIDWYSVNTQHEAVVLPDEDSVDKLRLVTKVTRLLDSEGEPDSGSGGKWMYVYNLDSMGKNEDGDTVYNTKLADGSLAELNPIGLTDDVVNNWFGKDIPSLLPTDSFTLPRSVTYTIGENEDKHEETFDVDLSKMVWNYEVAPVMPYGVLDYLAVQGTIDFSKLGSGLIDLTAWRYYNSGDVSTLTWGLDAYTEPNKGIAEVVFDFYDNQGYAASYHNANKTSYAGTFTESIVLGQQNSSYKLNGTDAYGNNDHCHAGMADDSGTVWLDNKNKPQLTEEGSSSGPYLNDVGTLYPNWLYLVRITVKYCNKNILDEYDTDNTTNFKTFYRWYWTNGVFNENYYSVVDFDVLIPQLPLDCSATFDTRGTATTNALEPKYVEYTDVENLSSFADVSTDLAHTLGAYVYAVNQDEADDDKGNIQMTVEPYISEAYNTFNMDVKELDQLSVTCSLGKSSITRTVEQPSLIYSGDEITTGFEDIVQPVTAKYLCSHNDNKNEPRQYFDRSGYISYGYGANGCYGGYDILSLLGATDKHDQYSSDVDYTPTSYPVNNEIYGNREAYKYYLDSFSLNFAGKWDSGYEFAKDGQIPLEYYDSTGTLVDDVTHYQYKTLTATAARSTGFPLVLAGTTYSKLYTAQCREDSDVKVLRSVIYDAYGEAGNSPDMLGLHLSGGHLYFNEVVSLGIGKRSGSKHLFRVYTAHNITNGTWTSTSTEQLDNDDEQGPYSKDYSASFTETFIQNNLKKAVTNTIVAFVIGTVKSSKSTVQYVYSTNSSFNSFRKTFGYSPSKYDKNYVYEGGDSDMPRGGSWDGEWANKYVIHMPAVRDTVNDLIVPITDLFLSHSRGVLQESSVDPGTTIPSLTLADMLGALFAQIYVVDETSKENGVILDDVVSVQDYTEYWNKDIVLDLKYVGSTDDNKDIKDLLCIQTQTMRNYLNFLIDNGGLPALDSGEYNTYNIDITLYPIQRSIAFQYGVPYALGNLQYAYSNLSLHKNIIYLSELDNSTQKLKVGTFTNDVSSNTFYTWDGVGAVVELGTGSQLYYGSGFSATSNERYLYMNANESFTSPISSASFSGLAKFMTYNTGGYITFGDYTVMPESSSSYSLSYKHASDSTELTGLPRISFLNEFKPI